MKYRLFSYLEDKQSHNYYSESDATKKIWDVSEDAKNIFVVKENYSLLTVLDSSVH